MSTKEGTMGVMRDTSATEATQRRIEVAVLQLFELFGAQGHGFYFGVYDAQKWSELQLWAADARRRVVVLRGRAADTIEIKLGEATLYVQGPAREATLDDYRRAREQEQC